MNTTMSTKEYNYLKSKNFFFDSKSTWVMDCSRPQLIETCSSFLTRLDDCMQLAYDDGNEDLSLEFSHIYSEVEPVYHALKEGLQLSISSRNEFRLLMKETLKMVPEEFA